MKRLLITCYIILCSLSVFALTYTRELESKANNGDAHSQYLLCHCYIDGLGIEIDYDEAFIWCEKAAHQGHKNALTQMGYFYFCGKGTKQDDKKAFDYFYPHHACLGLVLVLQHLKIRLTRQIQKFEKHDMQAYMFHLMGTAEPPSHELPYPPPPLH